MLRFADTLRLVSLVYCRSSLLCGGTSVTVQALGWRSGGRYLPLQDDIASVAYFYL